MPTTKVKSPDGEIITVKHPAGASQEEIIAYAKANYSPASDVGHAEGLAAAGTQGLTLGFADEIGAGVATAASYLDPRSESQSAFEGMSAGDRYRAIRDSARGRSASYAEANPGKALTAEIVGGLATGGAGASRLVGLKGAKLVSESGKIGAALGGSSGAGFSEADSAGGVAVDTAIGAGAGLAAGRVFPAIGNKLASAKAQAVAGKSSDPYIQAVNVLEKNKIPLTTAQKSGANWAKAAETTLEEVPWGGKPLQVARESSRRSFQRRLFEMVGLKDGSDMLTRETLDKMSDKLSIDYTRALKGKTIDIADDSFLDALADIEARHSGFVDSTTEGKIRQIVDKFVNEASKGPLKDGKWYQAQRSIFREKGKGTNKLAGLYKDLKVALDDAFARAAGPQAKGDVDARYGQYKQLQSLFERLAGGAEGAEGFIPPGQLARLAEKNAGSREWRELIRAAATVMPDRIGNSGTAQRQALLGMMGGAAIDPASLLYGPMIARGVGGQLAKGRQLDVTKLMPDGKLLRSPGLVAPTASAGLVTRPER